MSEPHTRTLLPSGRSIVVHVSPREEELLVQAPDGRVEVRIVLDADGATVRLGAARLEIDAPSVAVNCETFQVDATGSVAIRAEEFRVATTRSIHLNGETVRLNCTEDAPAPTLALAQPTTTEPCGCPTSHEASADAQPAPGVGFHEFNPR